MPIQQIALTFNNDINTSLQVGDIVYYSPLSTVAGSGFSTVTTGNVIKLGVINEIDHNTSIVSVLYDSDNITPPSSDDYIMFEKDKRVNSSSLIGYYADVHFVNYSKDKIELYSIGSEITESSK
jgi:hypothetical protein